jgi:hypothetical protein
LINPILVKKDTMAFYAPTVTRYLTKATRSSSRKQIAIESKDAIEHQLNKALEDKLLQEKGIDKSILDSVSSASTNAISVSNTTVDESGKEKETNAGLAYGIGFGSGLLIYITMFIFGAMVMAGCNGREDEPDR